MCDLRCVHKDCDEWEISDEIPDVDSRDEINLCEIYDVDSRVVKNEKCEIYYECEIYDEDSKDCGRCEIYDVDWSFFLPPIGFVGHSLLASVCCHLIFLLEISVQYNSFSVQQTPPIVSQ